MAHEYGRFDCRVCGDQVFVPLQLPILSNASVELTCSNGHTDSYDAEKLELIISKPMEALKARRATAAVG